MKKSLPIYLLMLLALSACGGAQQETTSTSTNSASEPIGGEVTSSGVNSGENSSETNSSESSSSESSNSSETQLAAVTNIKVKDGVLSFDAVEGAIDYLIVIKQNNAVLYQTSTTKTSLDLNDLGFYGGHYTVTITARSGLIESTPATLNFTLLHVDNDMRLEAEFALLDRDRNWADDSNASNGAYGLGFDDCGQGMYFRYYAFEAGNRDVTVAYSTAMPGSYMTLFANGQIFRVDYNTNTDWFGESHTTADVVIENVPFVEGWNELYLIKNGVAKERDEGGNIINDDGIPEYGGYAQVDYITIKGTGKSFDETDYDKTSNSYKLEAEMAHWHWANTNMRPANWGGKFSLGFGLGEMNNDGDGCKFTIDIKESGTYSIRPALGGPKTIKVKVDEGAATSKNFGVETAWYDVVLSDNPYQVYLTNGKHDIDILRDDNWFVLDYLLLEKIS